MKKERRKWQVAQNCEREKKWATQLFVGWSPKQATLLRQVKKQAAIRRNKDRER